MNKLFCTFALVFFISSCSGYKVDDGKNWWEKNNHVALEIKEMMSINNSIVRVDPKLSDKFVSNAENFSEENWQAYNALKKIALKNKISNIIAYYPTKADESFVSLELIVKTKVLTSDSCMLSIKYISNPEYHRINEEKSVRMYALDGTNKWFVIISDSSSNCLR
jgi:hypothetical protein